MSAVSAPSFEVTDDLLSADEFAALVEALRRLSLRRLGPEWNRTWDMSEPMPMVSEAFRWSRRPVGQGLDALVERIAAEVQRSALFGVPGRDWGDLVFRVFLQSRGMRLGWHGDSGHRGTAVFFAHARWEPDWGGELLLPRTDTPVEPTTPPEQVQAEVLRHGRGEYLMPLPNRLVLIRRGVWHGTQRVDPDAGAALRCAVAMFATPP